LVGRKVA
jgi:hypothetical protein